VTVKIVSQEQRVGLYIDGDIYDEHAESIKEIALLHARRGIKDVEIRLGTTYYISKNGQEYLFDMTSILEKQGVRVSFNS